jgi:hypothetical protein
MFHEHCSISMENVPAASKVKDIVTPVFHLMTAGKVAFPAFEVLESRHISNARRTSVALTGRKGSLLTR